MSIGKPLTKRAAIALLAIALSGLFSCDAVVLEPVLGGANNNAQKQRDDESGTPDDESGTPDDESGTPESAVLRAKTKECLDVIKVDGVRSLDVYPDGSVLLLAGEGEGGTKSMLKRYSPDNTVLWTLTDLHSIRSAIVLPDNDAIMVGDSFAARIDENGSMTWSTEDMGGGEVVAATPDGGFIVGGYLDKNVTFGPGEPSEVVLGNIQSDTGSHNGSFLAKYRADGSLEFARSLGDDFIQIEDILVLADGSFLMATNGILGMIPMPFPVDDTSWDSFVGLYHPDGSTQWKSGLGGLGVGFIEMKIMLNSDNTLSVAGTFCGEFLVLESRTGADPVLKGSAVKNEDGTLSSCAGTLFIAQYAEDGALLGAAEVEELPRDNSNHGSSAAGRVAPLTNDKFIVIGTVEGEVIFDPGGAQETQLGTGLFAATYNADTTLNNVQRLSAADIAYVKAVTATRDGAQAVFAGEGPSNDESELDFYLVRCSLE